MAGDKVLNCQHRNPPGTQSAIITDFVEAFLCRSRNSRWPLSVRIGNSFGNVEIRPAWDDLVSCAVYQIWRANQPIIMADSVSGAVNLAFEYLKGDTICYTLALTNKESDQQPIVHLMNSRQKTKAKAKDLLQLAITAISAK